MVCLTPHLNHKGIRKLLNSHVGSDSSFLCDDTFPHGTWGCQVLLMLVDSQGHYVRLLLSPTYSNFRKPLLAVFKAHFISLWWKLFHVLGKQELMLFIIQEKLQLLGIVKKGWVTEFSSTKLDKIKKKNPEDPELQNPVVLTTCLIDTCILFSGGNIRDWGLRHHYSALKTKMLSCAGSGSINHRMVGGRGEVF